MIRFVTFYLMTSSLVFASCAPTSISSIIPQEQISKQDLQDQLNRGGAIIVHFKDGRPMTVSDIVSVEETYFTAQKNTEQVLIPYHLVEKLEVTRLTDGGKVVVGIYAAVGVASILLLSRPGSLGILGGF